MTRTLLAVAVSALFASAAHAAEPRLTVYSGDYDSVVQSEAMPGGPGFALYESTLGFDLRDGNVSQGGLPTALDASSVRLKPRGNASVRSQRFDFAVAGQDELLRRAIGQTVTVEQSSGGNRQSHTGVLMAAGNGLTLRLPDGRVKVLSEYSSFELPKLPQGIVNEPTLSWDIAGSGRQDFDFAYATAGLAWRAEYQVDLSGQAKACRMDIDGAAMVVNRSGADFNGVALTLVAGQPNRAPASGPMQAKGYARAEMMVADAAAPAPVASGEYHAYRLPGSATLPQGSVQRLPLIDPARGIACERRYEARTQMGDWRPPYPMIDAGYNSGNSAPAVIASLQFDNRKSDGLGVPLPAGRVRVFDGGDLLGEATLEHTPANKPTTLDLGTVFDLTTERTRDDFALDRSGRTMEERVTVIVRNAKTEAATVHVIEQMTRWSDWEIVSSTVPASKRDAQTSSFALSVPANGTAKLTYTVRYRWAPDVQIP